MSATERLMDELEACLRRNTQLTANPLLLGYPRPKCWKSKWTPDRVRGDGFWEIVFVLRANLTGAFDYPFVAG